MDNNENIKNVESCLNLSRTAFIEKCLLYIETFNDGELFDVAEKECPMQTWVVHNNINCRDVVEGTKVCPLCGKFCCPDCMNHLVEPISRVTGYMSGISGWNASKKQEFEDRNRTTNFGKHK